MLRGIELPEEKEYKTNCLGYKNSKKMFCTILKRADCKGCSFYQTEIDSKRVKRDIARYTNKKGE